MFAPMPVGCDKLVGQGGMAVAERYGQAGRACVSNALRVGVAVLAFASVMPGSAYAGFRFERAWGERGESPGQFGGIEGIAAGPDGSVYVLDRGDLSTSLYDYPSSRDYRPRGSVQRFDADGKFLGAWGRDGNRGSIFDRPAAIATDPAGNVHVLDSESVQVFTGGGSALRKFALQHGNGGYTSPLPADLAVDGAGFVYVLEAGFYAGAEVYKYDPSGGLVTKWQVAAPDPATGGGASSIDIDPAGNAHALLTGGDLRQERFRVPVFDGTGALVRSYGFLGHDLGTIASGGALAIDGAGSPHVFDGRLQKFGADGRFQFGHVLDPREPSVDLATDLAIAANGTVYVAGQNRVSRFAPTDEGKAPPRPPGGQADAADLNPPAYEIDRVRLLARRHKLAVRVRCEERCALRLRTRVRLLPKVRRGRIVRGARAYPLLPAVGPQATPAAVTETLPAGETTTVQVDLSRSDARAIERELARDDAIAQTESTVTDASGNTRIRDAALDVESGKARRNLTIVYEVELKGEQKSTWNYDHASRGPCDPESHAHGSQSVSYKTPAPQQLEVMADEPGFPALDGVPIEARVERAASHSQAAIPQECAIASGDGGEREPDPPDCGRRSVEGRASLEYDRRHHLTVGPEIDTRLYERCSPPMVDGVIPLEALVPEGTLLPGRRPKDPCASAAASAVQRSRPAAVFPLLPRTIPIAPIPPSPPCVAQDFKPDCESVDPSQPGIQATGAAAYPVIPVLDTSTGPYGQRTGPCPDRDTQEFECVSSGGASAASMYPLVPLPAGLRDNFSWTDCRRECRHEAGESMARTARSTYPVLPKDLPRCYVTLEIGRVHTRRFDTREWREKVTAEWTLTFRALRLARGPR